MLDLTIQSFNLRLDAASGQEHRARPIARRAVELLVDRLEATGLVPERLPSELSLESLEVPPVELDLPRLTDEQAANAIASAIVDALTLRLEFGT